MKRLELLIGTIICILFLSNCSKETMKYEGTDGVYFAVQWGPSYTDSTQWAFQSYTPVDFINMHGKTHTAKLRVMVTGNKKDHDRKFGVRINMDSTTAVANEDYLPLEQEYVIKAGQLYTDIPVELIRSQSIQTEKRILGINLISSEDFNLAIPTWYALTPYFTSTRYKTFDATYHQIELTDFITKPKIWYGASNNGVEAGLWGEFTTKKFLLICELNDLVYDDFASTATMHTIRREIINQVMKAYLQSMFDKKTPVLEDDGRLMWVMGVSWSSTIGKPYNP